MKTNETNIANRAMIINLSISQWSGRKLDRQVTDETNQAHGASSDAGRFNKLLVDKKALAPIQSAANAARLFVYDQTLPWGDNGDRVLMASNYFDFTAKMRQYEQEFNDAVDDLMGGYLAYVEQARFRLNSMFKSSDYPSESEVRTKFNMRYVVRPVPTAGDFRVDMSKDVVDELRQQIAKDNETVLNAAMQTVWEEVKTTMSHLYEKLADPKMRFKESTIKNLETLADRIPHLNLIDDPDLETFRKELKDGLVGYTAKELREDDKVRSAAAVETKRIIDKFQGVWA